MIEHVANWRPMWPMVRVGLEQIIAKTSPSWIPEDVYAELKSGAAALFTVDDHNAFLVAKRINDYDGQVLFIWAIWGPNEFADSYREVQDELAKIARSLGCSAMRMTSPRRGWRRAGWTERETIYEVKL